MYETLLTTISLKVLLLDFYLGRLQRQFFHWQPSFDGTGNVYTLTVENGLLRKRSYIKKGVRKVHLWLGLISGLVLSIVGITGSLYVFEPEIAAYLERELYLMEGNAVIFENDVELAAFLENNYEQQVESIQWPKRGRETYILKFFGDDHWYYFDQSNGKLTKGGLGTGNAIFNFILNLHRTLTLGKAGQLITGIVSILFAFFMLSTGLYLWWPRTKTRKKISFRIQWNAKPKILNYNIHNVSGFYFFLPLFLMGLTGAGFYFSSEFKMVLNALTFSVPSKKIEIVEDRSYYTKNDLMTLVAVLKEMDKYHTEFGRRNLWMTNRVDGDVSLGYQKRTDIYAGPDTRIFLTLHPVTGKVLREYHPDRLPRGEAIMAKWLLQVHFGEFGGLFTRILWFFAGFLPALLTYTGVKIWMGRTFKKKNPNPPKRVFGKLKIPHKS